MKVRIKHLGIPTVLILIFLLIFGTSWGQLIPFNENFSYPTGNLVGQGGSTVWTLQGSDNTNPIQVNSPGLFYPGYLSSGIGLAATLGQNSSGQDLFRNFTGANTINSGSVYIAALVKVNVASRAGDYFLSFKETTGASLTVFKGRLYAKDTANTGNLVFGVTKSASGSSAPVSWTSQYFSFGTTYLVVLKYTFISGTANDVVDIFIFDPANPFPVFEPSSPSASASDVGSDGTGQRCVQLRQGGLNSAMVNVDGIRVSQTWVDAVAQDIAAPVATFNPVNGAINVVLSVIPTITFDEPVRKTDGTDLTNSDLATLITFKTDNASGTSVPFTATIDATKTIITVTPTSALVNSQAYYLSISPVEDGAGNESGLQNATFTTIPSALSNDATLSDLQVNGTTVAGFSPMVYSYDVVIPYGLPTIPTVTPTTTFPLAVAIVTPTSVLPGISTVLVTAQDGITQLTYSISFTYAPPSTNSALSYIKWLPNGLDPLKQNIRVKDFDPTIFNYNIEVPMETTTLVVDAEPDFVIPASGCPPATYIVIQPLNLSGNLMERTATIVCTAQDGNSTTSYIVTFSKASSSNAYVFKEGFNVMPPSGWSNTSNVGTSTTNGMGFFGSASPIATPKFKFVAPNDGGIITTSAYNGAGTLEFFVKVLDKNPASNLHLFVEKSYDNSNWILVSQDPMPLYATITQWHQVVLPINDNNTSIYFRFRATATAGDNSTGLFYVDDVSLSEMPPSSKTLNLKAYIEGFWNVNAMNQVQDADIDYNIFNKFPGSTVDTLSVLLAEAYSPWGYIMEVHGLNINPDGTMSITIPSSFSGSYYIVIKQRNSVEIWSANAVDISGSNNVYDFTTSASQAFGSNQKDLNGDGSVWGLFSGDFTSSISDVKDEYVDFFDLNEIFNLNLISAFGYQPADLTGDGFVDFFDLNMAYNNNLSSIGMNTPLNPAKLPNRIVNINLKQ